MTDILDDSYESDLTEEEHERLILMSEHAIAKPLSPATQVVLDAFRTSHTGQGCLAAALRAAADQVVPMALCIYNDDFVCVRHQLHAIADELEAQ